MLAFGSVSVDLTAQPVIVLTERRETARVEDFLRAFNALLARERPFASIHDVRSCRGWDAFDRSVVHQWLKQRTDTLKRLVRGHCAVLANQEQRGMGLAVFWDTEFAGHVRFFNDLASAEAWARQRSTGRRQVG